MIPDTTSRVSSMTAETVNAMIRRHTEESVSHYASAGPEAIERRLQELDREWDIERRPRSKRCRLNAGRCDPWRGGEPQMVHPPWRHRRVPPATCNSGMVSATPNFAPPGPSHRSGDQSRAMRLEGPARGFPGSRAGNQRTGTAKGRRSIAGRGSVTACRDAGELAIGTSFVREVKPLNQGALDDSHSISGTQETTA